MDFEEDLVEGNLDTRGKKTRLQVKMNVQKEEETGTASAKMYLPDHNFLCIVCISLRCQTAEAETIEECACESERNYCRCNQADGRCVCTQIPC
mmetsp:Transcript_12922/g.25277  ORF Transcript_12922/g.25277 Transcript_12922/m.25277 type:complete len:94 (-) Transcript_12922:1477-1758(-)